MLQSMDCPSLKERTFRSTSAPTSSLAPVGRPGRYKRWTEEHLQKACQCVEQGELSIRCAAETFDIPKSTLHDRITGKIAFGSRSGPPRYLNDAEEGELVNFLVGCSKVGYSC